MVFGWGVDGVLGFWVVLGSGFGKVVREVERIKIGFVCGSEFWCARRFELIEITSTKLVPEISDLLLARQILFRLCEDSITLRATYLIGTIKFCILLLSHTQRNNNSASDYSHKFYL